MIRDAVPGDGRGIAEVHVASWLGAYRGLLPDEALDALDAEARAQVWEERLAEPPFERYRVLVLDEGEVRGFASLGPSRDPDAGEDVGELYALYLEPGRWGHGLGRALHGAAVKALAEAGFAEATLWVLDSNERARRFYERSGWWLDGAERRDRIGPLRTLVGEVRYRLGLRASAP